jgi:hypothetical protein
MRPIINKFFSLPGPYLIVMAFAGLAILMIYSALKGEQIYNNLHAQIANPNQYEFKTVCLSFIKIEDIDNSDAMAIDRRLNTYYLKIDESWGVKKSETYSLTGYIERSGRIKVTEIQANRHRNLKYLFSSLSFIIIIFLVVKYIRFDPKGIYLKEYMSEEIKTNGNIHF